VEQYEENIGHILGYCVYCKGIVYEHEGYICIDGNYYHYSKNYLLNCYFPEDEENEEEKI